MAICERKEKSIKPPKLTELSPLDLNQCHTVGQILEAMSRTPVGSGMLGRLAMDLRGLISQGNKPLVVFDGLLNSPVGKLIQKMNRRWFSGVVTPEEYLKCKGKNTILVVGRFSERHEKILCSKPKRAFFVNQWGFAGPNNIQDGYFKDVVVADPAFLLSLLYLAFEEWFDGKPWKVNERFISWVGKHGGAGEKFACGARVSKAMMDDPKCTVVFTATGVLTVAQMSPILCDLIDAGKIQIVVTTGALLGHGLVWSIDLHHYRHDPSINDSTLAFHSLNRITDAIEPETNLDHVEEVIQEVFKELPEGYIAGSADVNRLIGEYLCKKFPQQRGILKSAAEKSVPVIIPAYYDSELGNDTITHNWFREKKRKKRILINLEKDAELLIKLFINSKRRGIMTLGGGPPRNTPQNVPPLVDILNKRLNMNMPVPMYDYGSRFCPDPIWLGHLGGCTYSEGISWRKFNPKAKLAEVRMDALHAFPFLAKYILSN